MAQVSAYQAKTHLSKLLDRVESGEEITITRHGKPVARMMPVREEERQGVAEAIADLKNFRIEKPFTGDEIVEHIHEERRS